MRKTLENGCEITRGQGVEVGLMSTEIPACKSSNLVKLVLPDLPSNKARRKLSSK